MRRYENLLKELDKRGFDGSDIFSQAAGAIRQLIADVGGGDTAIRALEQEVDVLSNQLQEAGLYDAGAVKRGVYDQSRSDGITELEQEAL